MYCFCNMWNRETQRISWGLELFSYCFSDVLLILVRSVYLQTQSYFTFTQIITELLDVQKFPRRPAYGLAAAKPLYLYDCSYGDTELKWNWDVNSALNTKALLLSTYADYKTRYVSGSGIFVMIQMSELKCFSDVWCWKTWRRDLGLWFQMSVFVIGALITFWRRIVQARIIIFHWKIVPPVILLKKSRKRRKTKIRLFRVEISSVCFSLEGFWDVHLSIRMWFA